MSREFYREFLFCFLFICGFKMRSAEFYPQVFQNMIITKGIFSVRQNVDWFECIKDCAVSEQCVSYNFEIASPRNSCELSKCGIRTNGGCSEEEVLRFSSGFVYQQLKESSKKVKINSIVFVFLSLLFPVLAILYLRVYLSIYLSSYFFFLSLLLLFLPKLCFSRVLVFDTDLLYSLYQKLLNHYGCICHWQQHILHYLHKCNRNNYII